MQLLSTICGMFGKILKVAGIGLQCVDRRAAFGAQHFQPGIDEKRITHSTNVARRSKRIWYALLLIELFGGDFHPHFTLFRFDKYGERKHPGIGQSCQHSHDYQKPD
jgi:hypothetical protein